MLDPIKSLLVDAEEHWINLDIGAEVTTRDVYRAIIKGKINDIHRMNALGAFLNNKIKYGLAESVGEKLSDPRYKKISNESTRSKNRRFCDVLNGSFIIGEEIIPIEFALRYKNSNPRDPITKNYIVKLLYALCNNKCIEKIGRGAYRKDKDIAEHEMSIVTRFIKAKKVTATNKPVSIIRTLPTTLPQVDGFATVKSKTLEKYISEIKTLKLIIKAQRRELSEKDRFIQTLPRFDLPDLETDEYADLKQKYGII